MPAMAAKFQQWRLHQISDFLKSILVDGDRMSVSIARHVAIYSGDVFIAMAFPNRQAIDFLGDVGQGQCCASFESADRGQVQIFLQPA